MSDDFSWLTSDQILTRKRKSGVSSLEILELPDELRELVNTILRHGKMRMEELIATLDRPADDVRGQVALLTVQGWLQTEEIEGEIYCRVRLGRRRRRSLPPGIWQILEGTWKMPLLRYFSDDEKTDFIRAFTLKQFEAGETMFEANEWGQTLYLIDVGQVVLVRQDVDGHEVVLARLKPGDVIGEVAVLLGETNWATARAVDPVSAWTLHKEDLDDLLARSPTAGLAIRREIERRISGLDQRRAQSKESRDTLPQRQEEYNPILVVGSGAVDLAQALSGYIGQRLLILDLHPDTLPTLAPDKSSDQENRRTVEQRSVRNLDSEELLVAVRQGLDEFDRVIIAAPLDLHGPLMGIISLIELVIDTSGTQITWLIAAARRRWIASALASHIEYTARRLCHRVIGLTLSGGAARTLAHIGALRALEEAQFPIDMIASTGIGAVVAGLYTAGFSVEELTDLAVRRTRDLNPFDGSLNLRLVSRSALYAGKRARNTLQEMLKGRTFADLSPPLYVVTADLESGQPVILDRGPLFPAMEASLALAGLVAPAELPASPVDPLNERSLVDGGLINPLPADVLVERGASIIIGVSTIPNTYHQTALSSRRQANLTSTWLRLRDQLAHTMLLNNLRHLDVLVTIPVGNVDGTDFDRAEEVIAAGLEATRQQIDHIRALLTPDF
jgi:NTE family protein